MDEVIQFHSRVGDDGILNVQLNLGPVEAKKEVIITVEPIKQNGDAVPSSTVSWQEIVQKSYGACAGAGLERVEQGEFESRETIE